MDTARLQRRFTSKLPHGWPRRTVRFRLTLLYGGLFLVSGAVLLTVVNFLWGNATSGPITVAPEASGILRIPKLLAQGSHPATFSSITVGQRTLLKGQLHIVAFQQHNTDLHQLLLYSGIALGITALLAIVLGWFMAGRFLRPLRTITTTARDISATNLHQRLRLGGPDDELKELGGTFDNLLERLERSFLSQGQFIANASHELRTPVATMRASLDVALAKPGPVPAQTIALADRLRPDLDQVDRLLESFLELARAQHGPRSDEATVSLDRIVSQALTRRTQIISDSGLEVDCGDCSAAPVNGSQTLLTRMVENLVDNAIQHNVEGGWIRVSVEVEGGDAQLVVENGGLILDAANVAELVQPFRRIGAVRTGSDAGTGLGLSIVASIAEVHGGTLVLHARRGGGLQVVIGLPLAVAAVGAASS